MATFNNQVADTNDDVFDNGTVIDLNGDAELVIGEHPSLSIAYTGGFRFTGVTIPQGATIDTATVTFVNQGNSTGTPSFLIKGQAADDAATFSTHADFIGRSRTTASVAWTPGAQSSGNPVTTSDIKSVIQEIVDRVGWVSGNDIVVFVENNGTNSWLLVYDYTGTAGNAAEIDITYTVSSGSAAKAFFNFI